MSILISILIIALLVFGVYEGQKKGLLKTLIGLIGLIAIVIISYSLRIPLANFLIDKMPFFNFGGPLAGLTTLNILLYNLIAFIVIFVVLYCVLNIIISLTNFIDTLLKFTVIWVIPSKIGGALLGFIETWIFVFLALFILVQFNTTSEIITNSKVANIVLDNTPLIGSYLGGAKDASVSIYSMIKKHTSGEYDVKELNRDILSIEIVNGLITKEKANELIDTGKLKLEDVIFGKGPEKWLNI